MKIIETNKIAPESFIGKDTERLWTYCGLDTMLTREIFEAISPQLDNVTNSTYRFSMELMGPILEMNMRGVRVDIPERNRLIEAYGVDLQVVTGQLNTILDKGLDLSINWRSPLQLKQFFYETMALAPVKARNSKGEFAPTVNRDALERLEADYFICRPFVQHILAARDLGKKISALETEVDPDGRMRTSYNIGGTNCVAGDSLILTRSGLQTIEKLYYYRRCQVYNEGQFYHPTNFIQNKDVDGFKIVLLGGYELKCSPNHPVLTLRGFVKAEELRLSDQVILKFGIVEQYGHAILPRLESKLKSVHSKTASIPTEMSRELCEFIGMWLADGSLDCTPGEHFRIRLSNNDVEVIARFRALGEYLFKVNFWFHDAEIGASSETLIRWLVELGLPANQGRGTARFKEVPKCILSAKSSMLRSLLRGLTLDTHFTDKGIAFGTQSPILQHQIQQILLLHGIESHKTDITTGIRLQVPRSYLGRFIAMIGFIQPWKLQKAAEFLNSNQSWHEPRQPNTLQPFEVKSISPWKGTVYDLTMPKESKPQYLANGIVVHNTGRLSSSMNDFGTGGNLQNLEERLRKVFVADEGMKFAYIDLEQAESRLVGAILWNSFHDGTYLDACEGGDLHTAVAKMVKPDLPWTGNLKEDKAIAEQPFYRQHSLRHMCKVLGHSSNYGGQPPTVAKHTKLPKELVADFQEKYFKAFPAIKLWHHAVERTIREFGVMTSLMGRRRHFFGRRSDGTTVREAIAYDPQGSVADILNTGMLKVWRSGLCQLLAQIHDALLTQYEEGKEDEILPQILKLVEVPIELAHGRTLLIPSEAKSGFNWANENPGNPLGLRKFTQGGDQRHRPAA